MNKIHVGYILITLLLVSSCAAIETSSKPSVPQIPSTVITTSSSSVTSSSQTTLSSPTSEESLNDRIEVVERSKYYYIGETFEKCYQLDITLFLNGVSKDVTYKPSYYNVVVKNSSNEEIDITKPFTKTGLYTYQFFYKGDISVASPLMSFSVIDSPTKTISSKSTLPTNFDYVHLENSCLDNLSLPSKGNVDVLVIPVEISDYPFTCTPYGGEYLNKIENLFNGDGANDTNYWESISSYYKKSSLNQLSLKFDIADTYACESDSSSLMSGGIYSSIRVAQKAVQDYRTKNGSASLKKYDNDSDGYIDGVWLIYSAPHYGTGEYGGQPGQDLFWAFCTDDLSFSPDINSPQLHSFGWASLSFGYEHVEANQIDSHTFIHETGHLLSLPDYYSYDYGGSSSSGAQGGLAMMDLNIGDQDSFSKMALGWANPYFLKEDCVIKIKPNESSGDCIVLADNWNGTAFDEYILLDLVTPTGLNLLDSTTAYQGRPFYYSLPGVRAYHIDARLAKFMALSNEESGKGSGIFPIKEENQADFYLTDDTVKKISSEGTLGRLSTDLSIPLSERTPGFNVVNANSASRALINEEPYINNRLITLIGADNKLCENEDQKASNDSLFREGDSWSMNAKTVKFFNGDIGKFNNNDKFSFVFSILKCDTNGATIQFKKVN